MELMTQEETVKRISKESEQYVSLLFGTLADGTWRINAKKDFIAGAKSERNKVLDEIRNVYTDTLPSGDCQAWDFVKAAQEFLKRLESLKVDL